MDDRLRNSSMYLRRISKEQKGENGGKTKGLKEVSHFHIESVLQLPSRTEQCFFVGRQKGGRWGPAMT